MYEIELCDCFFDGSFFSSIENVSSLILNACATYVWRLGLLNVFFWVAFVENVIFYVSSMELEIACEIFLDVLVLEMGNVVHETENDNYVTWLCHETRSA